MTASLDRAVEAAYPALMHALVNGSSNPDALREALIAALPHLGVDREALRGLAEKWRESAKSAANGPMFDGASEYAVAGTFSHCADELLALIDAKQES